MLALDLELAALFVDFAEQPRVLDRQHGLVGEGLEQVDGLSRKQPGFPPANYEEADDVVGPHQRRYQQRPITGAPDDVVDQRVLTSVRNLNRFPLRARARPMGRRDARTFPSLP